VLFQLGPRDERNAARTAAWIYLVSALVILVSNLIVPLSIGVRLRGIVLTMPLLAFGALLAWPRFKYKGILVLVSPLIGVFFTVSLNLATHDVSAGAQVGFCLPVLFGASQLRFIGAFLGAVAAVVGDALVVWKLERNSGGLVDVVDLTLVLVLMTGLLVQAGRRQDRLVALLESQASLDPLTGLVTRRVLDDAVQQALAKPTVRAGTALILVDVDHFKSINDTYGHPVGDDALVHIARVLSRHSRPDTVISRLGGDEIAVLLLGCTEGVARKRAHEFLHAIRDNPLQLPDGAELAISISVGCAHAPSGESHLRELYAAADASLYEAKRAGRGRVGRSALGLPMFEGPPTETGLEGISDGLLEMRHVSNGVLQREVGSASDDRINHR
jgi:diguanylate cyclase (GGDEF)-like protein